MAFSSVSNQEKLIALNAAKVAFERDIYKNLFMLGIDPETYVLSSFTFDENASTLETDPDYAHKKNLDTIITRLNAINAKIADLS